MPDFETTTKSTSETQQGIFGSIAAYALHSIAGRIVGRIATTLEGWLQAARTAGKRHGEQAAIAAENIRSRFAAPAPAPAPDNSAEIAELRLRADRAERTADQLASTVASLTGSAESFAEASAESADQQGRTIARLETRLADITRRFELLTRVDEDPFQDDTPEPSQANTEPSEADLAAEYEAALVRVFESEETSALYEAIMVGGGIKTGDTLREEYRSIPNVYKRRNGMRGDDMADYLATEFPELGIRTERDLIDAMSEKYGARA